MQNISILFVCLGNICRSPTAEAVAQERISKRRLNWLTIDSAGTSAYHEGALPDQRSQEAGIARGYSFAGQGSRQVTLDDFDVFDHIIAMDHSNLRELSRLKLQKPTSKAAIWLFMNETIGMAERDMPDPYYMNGFDNVLTLCEEGVDKWIAFLEAQ